MAHVMEMEGRQDEGIKFMSETIENWKVCEMRFYEIAPFEVVKLHFLSRQLNVSSLQQIVHCLHYKPLRSVTETGHGDSFAAFDMGSGIFLCETLVSTTKFCRDLRV